MSDNAPSRGTKNMGVKRDAPPPASNAPMPSSQTSEPEQRQSRLATIRKSKLKQIKRSISPAPETSGTVISELQKTAQKSISRSRTSKPGSKGVTATKQRITQVDQGQAQKDQQIASTSELPALATSPPTRIPGNSENVRKSVAQILQNVKSPEERRKSVMSKSGARRSKLAGHKQSSQPTSGDLQTSGKSVVGDAKKSHGKAVMFAAGKNRMNSFPVAGPSGGKQTHRASNVLKETVKSARSKRSGSKKAKAIAVKAAAERKKTLNQNPKEEPAASEMIPEQKFLGLFTLKKGAGAGVRGQPATRIHIPWFIWILSRDSGLAIVEIFFCINLLVYNLLVSFLLVFQYNSVIGNWTLAVIELLFISDFLFRLIVEVWRQFFNIDYRQFLVPVSFKLWMFSVIGLFPLSQIASFFLSDSIDGRRAIYACKLPLVIAWYRFYFALKKLEAENFIDPQFAFLLRFFGLYIAFAHYVACFFFYITGVTSTDVLLERHAEKAVGTWLDQAFRVKPGIISRPPEHYLLSIEMTLTMLTTVGYGDYAPGNEGEMMVAVAVILLGSIVLTGFFGSALTGFLLNQDGERYQFFHRVDLIMKILDRLKAPPIHRNKMRGYYDNLWNFRQGVYRATSLDALPPAVREEILVDICAEMFKKSFLFRGLDRPFLRTLSKNVEVCMFNPDIIVCPRGQPTWAMYFIIQGECVIKSPSDSAETTAILRPKCIFGEHSLFFSVPLSANIETRTCCQFLVLRKRSLLQICSDIESDVMVPIFRERMQKRLRVARQRYKEVGEYPITWTERKAENDEANYEEGDYLVTLRSTKNLNPKVKPDYLGQTDGPVIVAMVLPKQLRPEDTFDVYGRCLMPMSMINPSLFLRVWHPFLASLIVILLLSINISYGTWAWSIQTEYFQDYGKWLDYFASVLFFADLWVEIFTATPAAGTYYKFLDGLHVFYKRPSLYVDIISCFPVATIEDISYAVFRSNGNDDLGLILELGHLFIGRIFKPSQPFRYINYLDERYPSQLVQLRLLRLATIIVTFIVSIAGVLYFVPCDPAVLFQENATLTCAPISWLQSYAILQYSETSSSSQTSTELVDDVSQDAISNRFPLVAPLYYTVALVSGVGYGDFTPQTWIEFIFSVLIQFFGIFLTGYITAKLTSALAASYVLKVKFEEKLLSIRKFFAQHGFSMRLRDRIEEHYRLKNQYTEGVSLPAHVKYLMYDAPPHLADEVLYADMSVLLEGVPTFNLAHPDAIIALAKLTETYVVPPNITFLHRGDVRRQLYIINRGSVAVVSNENHKSVLEILEATCHFGLRDLLYGEPAFHDVVTLSYCVIYAIDYATFKLIFQHDPDLMAQVELGRKRVSTAIRGRLGLGAELVHEVTEKAWVAKERKPTPIPSWITFPTKEKPEMDFCTYEEFMEGYEGQCGSFLKFFLMPRTVHPAGSFALVWCLLTGFAAVVVVVINLHVIGESESAEDEEEHAWEVAIFWMAKIFFLMESYLRLHWGFYTEQSNYLICHPVETAKNYLFEGPFLFSYFVELLEYSWSLILVGSVETDLEGGGREWVRKFSYNIIFYFPRVRLIIRFARRVSTRRTFLLAFIYLLCIIALSTTFAIIALVINCSEEDNQNNQGKPTMVQTASTAPDCIPRFAASKEYLRQYFSEEAGTWVVSMYYVSQSMFAVGYGDMISLNELDMAMVIMITLVGYIATRFVIADIAAAVISGDQVRSDYQEKIKRIFTVMRKQNVDAALVKKVHKYLKHTWLMSKGLDPQELLSDLHPALQTDLFKEYSGDAVRKVPVFAKVNVSTLRTLCTYLKKLYFTAGDRIARRGHFEFEMYIIFDGDLWVTQDGNVICTLGPGESFGETQMMYGMPRKYSLYAINSVEVFMLDALSFAEILECYPGLKSLMESQLGGLRLDMFERKVHLLKTVRLKSDAQEVWSDTRSRVQKEEFLDDEFTHHQALGDADGEEHKRRTGGRRNIFRRNFLDWGTANDDLPLIYLAVASDSSMKKKPGFLLHPSCGLQRLIYNLTFFVSVLSPALALFIVVSGDEAALWLSDVFEAIYWLHILTSFVTPFPTVGGHYCKDPGRIVYRYLSNINLFWLDLISSIPIGLVVGFFDPKFEIYWNLIRVLRLVYYFRALRTDYESIAVTAFRQDIRISVTLLGLMVHVLACIFYLDAACDGTKCPEGTWTADFLGNYFGNKPSEEDVKTWRWYVRSLYFVIATVSSTGIGDIVPISITDVIISIVCMLCGAFLVGIILGQLTHGITSLNLFQREYLYQLYVDVRYLASLGLSVHHQRSVTEWFLLRWDYSRGVSFSDAISILPLSLRHSVSLALYQETLNKVALFDGLDTTFFTTLATLTEHTVYLPGQVIAHEGDTGSALFIVAAGRVSGYSLTRLREQKLIRWYRSGCVFGRLPVLFYGQTYTKTYRAEVTSEILTISKYSVFYLLRCFPEFVTNVQLYMEGSYEPELGTETLFTPEVNPNVREAGVQASNRISRAVGLKIRRMSRRKRRNLRARWSLRGVKQSLASVALDAAKQAEAMIEDRSKKYLSAYAKVLKDDKKASNFNGKDQQRKESSKTKKRSFKKSNAPSLRA